LASNVGSSAIMQACVNQPVENWPDAKSLIELFKPSLYQQFKPAFLGRMQIVPYYPLHDELLIQIIQHKLGKITQRIQQQYATQVTYNEDLLELLLSRCTEVDSGARNIDHILNASVLPALATEILRTMSEGKIPKLIHIEIKNDEIFYSVDPKVKIAQKVRSKSNKADAA
jgi:type VI secretion system protein VasG